MLDFIVMQMRKANLEKGYQKRLRKYATEWGKPATVINSINVTIPWMPEVFSLASGKERQSK